MDLRRIVKVKVEKIKNISEKPESLKVPPECYLLAYLLLYFYSDHLIKTFTGVEWKVLRFLS